MNSFDKFDKKELEFDALMKQMAADHHADLPSAQAIWWRARIQKKFENEKRVERPLMLVRLATAILGLIAALALASRFRLITDAPFRSGYFLAALAMTAAFAVLGFVFSMPERLRRH